MSLKDDVLNVLDYHSVVLPGHICGPESNCDCLCEEAARDAQLIDRVRRATILDEHDLLNLRMGYMSLAERILLADKRQVGGMQPQTLGYERYEIRMHFTGYALDNIRDMFEKLKDAKR